MMAMWLDLTKYKFAPQVTSVSIDCKTVVFGRFRKARSAVSAILACEAREPRTPVGRVRLQTALRSHIGGRPRSQKIRLFCSLAYQRNFIGEAGCTIKIIEPTLPLWKFTRDRVRILSQLLSLLGSQIQQWWFLLPYSPKGHLDQSWFVDQLLSRKNEGTPDHRLKSSSFFRLFKHID